LLVDVGVAGGAGHGLAEGLEFGLGAMDAGGLGVVDHAAGLQACDGLLGQEQQEAEGGGHKKTRRRKVREGNQGCNQAWGGVIQGVAMRLRRRRLQPKAAPTPRHGRGPGTEAGPMYTLMDSEVPLIAQVPTKPLAVKPSPARLLPLNVALLKKS